MKKQQHISTTEHHFEDHFAGSPMSNEDLIFHLLRGLPKVFNSFKTVWYNGSMWALSRPSIRLQTMVAVATAVTVSIGGYWTF